MKSLVPIFALCAALTSCGGGTGSSEVPWSSVPVGVVSGTVFSSNAIGGATITIRNYVTGSIVGTGSTAQDGTYKVDLKVEDSAPLLIEATGGQYVEPASGASVTLASGQIIRATINYVSGSSVFAAVTPYTNLAAGLVAYRIKTGIQTSDAITQSNSDVGELLSFEATTVIPRDITNPSNRATALGDDYSYGLINAAISSWTKYASAKSGKSHSELNTILFADYMYQDVIADGALNGMGRGASGSAISLSFGSINLSRDIYRYGLPAHVVSITNDNAVNKTTLGETKVLRFAQWYAGDTGAIWAPVAPLPFTNGRPEVAFTVPTLNQVIRGVVVPVMATVSSLGNIDAAVFAIDGTNVGTPAANPASPSSTFNSKNYSDGIHELKISVVDSFGIQASNTLAVTVDNTTPTVGVAFTTPTSNQVVRGNSVAVYGTVSPGAGVAASATLTIDGVVVGGPATNPASPSFTFNSKNYSDGTHALRISVIDSYGIPTSSTISVQVDNTTPTVTVALNSPVAGSWVRGSAVTVNASLAGLGIPATAANLMIDGVPVGSPSATPNNPSFTFNSTSYTFGAHTLGVNVLDSFGIPATGTSVVNVDNVSPTMTYTGWTPSVTYGAGATISGTSSDQGSGVSSISIPGYPTSMVYPNAQGGWTLTYVVWVGGAISIEVRDKVGNCSKYSAPLTSYACPSPQQVIIGVGPGCYAPNTYFSLPISSPFTLVSTNYAC